ncbi:MAG TPA: DNA repair protein RadC [Candidatus Paceibacterota bacterium]
MTQTTYNPKDTDFVMAAPAPAYEGYDGREYPLRLKDWPDDSKPREKLLSGGVASLSLQELLSVILNTGTKKEGVLEMSQKIIREYGMQALTSQTDPEAMSAELDIPLIKACQVVAAGEIGRRLFKKDDVGLTVIRTARDAYEFLQDMHGLPKEQLRGLYLDTHNRVIHQEVISIGTINSNIVHPREVFRPALEYGAASVVLAHNHPSGIATPSVSDIEITKQLVQAGKIIGISLLDHIVITKDGFTSVQVDY